MQSLDVLLHNPPFSHERMKQNGSGVVVGNVLVVVDPTMANFCKYGLIIVVLTAYYDHMLSQ